MDGELSCAVRTRLASGFELEADFRLPFGRAPITVLFGPSGAGKTTLLRMLAGLDRPSQGAIVFRGDVWFDAERGVCLPPQQRRAGYVAQDYALFPHLTVAANVAYAAQSGKGAEYLATFGLAGMADRYPSTISGGQRQRVALARALAAEPNLLLLDEPLSALDAAARERTRRQLRELLAASGVPCIVVTHDRREAVALGDWIAVISGGRVRQCGPVQDVFQRPADADVAESLGVENVVPAHVIERAAGLVTVETCGARLQAIDTLETGGETGEVVVCIRGEDIGIARDSLAESSVRNRLAGVVTAVTMEGPLARVELDCGFPLVALITAQSARDLGLRRDDRVSAIVKTTAVNLAARSGGAT
jgi:molybdate transport system ATP-binding protein